MRGAGSAGERFGVDALRAGDESEVNKVLDPAAGLDAVGTLVGLDDRAELVGDVVGQWRGDSRGGPARDAQRNDKTRAARPKLRGLTTTTRGSSGTGNGSPPPGEQDDKSPVTGDCHGV